MDGGRGETFGAGGSATPAVASPSEPLQRHPGLSPEPSDPGSEPQPELERELERRIGAAHVVAQPQAAQEPGGIGQLHYVDPGELWPTGEGELLAWLGQNPGPLAIATGLALRPLAEGAPRPEESLLLETDIGEPVVVVLDLGESSDDALGRLMRTVAAKDAKAAIWAVATARNEHLASMSWLNRMVAERSFIVQLRGVRIDNSRPAPIFGPLLRPPRHDDRPPTVPSADSSPSPEVGRRADDQPTISLIERGTERPD